MKVLLILPPQWVPQLPYLSVPSLTANLRQHGINVIQKDFNMETYEILLSERYLNGLTEKLWYRFARMDSKDKLLPGLEQGYYNDLFMSKSLCAEVAARVDGAKKALRNPKIIDDINALQEAREVLDQALAIISMAYYPTKIELSSFRIPLFSGSMEDLKQLTQNEDLNPFVDLFRSHFIPLIRELKPDVIGLTIAGQSQQIPALTLSRLIKQMPEKPHVVVGGHFITLLNDVLTKRNELFDLFIDSAVRFDGERPLLELVERLDKGYPLDDVPNLVFRDARGIHANEISPPEDINSLPTPDFSGLPLDKYLSPALILPLQSSRGCYWNRCAFCTHSLGYGKRYQSRDAAKVVADIRELEQKYGVTHIAFEDEVISPNAANKISDEILKSGVKVTLSTNIRLEKQFTPGLCRKLSKAGFKLLYLGFESGCQRVLDLMGKGTVVSTAAEVLRNVQEAGIWSHLYIMFGFPGEKNEDAQQTIQFLLSHKDIVRSFHTENFVLSKSSIVHQHPERFGVVFDKNALAGDFNSNQAFIDHSGITQTQALGLAKSTMDGAAREFEGDRILSAVGHFYLIIYLSHFTDIDNFIKAAAQRKKPEEQLSFKITRDSSLRLKKGVVLEKLGFNLMALRQQLLEGKESVIYPERTLLAFNRSKGRFRRVSDQAAEILALCNGKRTIINIAQELVAKYDAPMATIEADCLAVFKSFAAEGYVI